MKTGEFYEEMANTIAKALFTTANKLGVTNPDMLMGSVDYFMRDLTESVREKLEEIRQAAKKEDEK